MKFSILSALALASSVFAQVDVDLRKPEDAIAGEYVDPSTRQPFLYDIQYNIVAKEGDVLEIYNGEEITLNYTFTNHEEEDVSIVGVGGSFANPLNGDILANITDAKLGPITVSNGETKVFTQRVGVNLPADNYLLIPGLYIVKGSALALLGAKTTLTIVSDPPISLFSPQLLLLEVLLLATFAIGGYFIWENFGQSYFKTTAKTANVSKVSKSSTPTPVAQATGKKTVDESWLPEGHKPRTTRRKAK